MRKIVLGVTVSIAAAAVVAMAADRAAAFGAIAVGEPADIARGGVAAGVSRNYPNKEGAEARALRECLSFPDAPASTRKLCKIVASFEAQCYAVALDPEAGTPGFGWAVRDTKAEADSAAMDRCRRTAGKSRVRYCKVTVSQCDETNSPSQ